MMNMALMNLSPSSQQDADVCKAKWHTAYTFRPTTADNDGLWSWRLRRGRDRPDGCAEHTSRVPFTIVVVLHIRMFYTYLAIQSEQNPQVPKEV